MFLPKHSANLCKFPGVESILWKQHRLSNKRRSYFSRLSYFIQNFLQSVLYDLVWTPERTTSHLPISRVPSRPNSVTHSKIMDRILFWNRPRGRRSALPAPFCPCR